MVLGSATKSGKLHPPFRSEFCKRPGGGSAIRRAVSEPTRKEVVGSTFLRCGCPHFAAERWRIRHNAGIVGEPGANGPHAMAMLRSSPDTSWGRLSAQPTQAGCRP